MKTRGSEECGSVAPNQERSPAQETLDEKGEIFSCGGVYLSQCRKPMLRGEGYRYLHLPTHQRKVMVLKNLEIHRLAGDDEDSRRATFQEVNSTQETLRRFFKEGLN
jgi:hypothetical protein